MGDGPTPVWAFFITVLFAAPWAVAALWVWLRHRHELLDVIEFRSRRMSHS